MLDACPQNALSISAAGQRSFVFQAVCLWNDLPKSGARIESLPHFETEVKKQVSEAFLN